MFLQKCLRPGRVRATLLVVLAVAALSVACSNPEKAKAEYVRQGEVYLTEKKFQEASIEFRNAIQIDDQLADAHWGLARAYEGLQRWGDVVEELNRTVTLDRNNLDARIKLGNFYLLPKPPRIDDAERFAAEILERDPNHIEGHILMANVLYLRGKRDEAFARLNRAIELNPQRVESHLALARFYTLDGDAAKADETFRRAIAVNERASAGYGEYGRFLIQQGRRDDAERMFARAVEVDPSNRDARLILASFYLVEKRFDKAEEAYKALAELDRDKPEGRAVLADFYSSVERFDEAANIYREIVAKSPDYARGRYRLGEMLLQRGDFAGASEQVAEVLKKNPRDMDGLILGSRLDMQRGEMNKAIEKLKDVLSQEPRSQGGLYYMAEAQFAAGQVEQARVFAGELERFYPEYPPALLPAKLMQTQISLATGDARTAQRLATELLDRLLKTAPGAQLSPQLLAELRVKALTSRGSANLQLKDLKAARADMEAAREVLPDSPGSYVNLAVVAFSEGRADLALQNYERALAIDATNFDALDGLIKVYVSQRRLDEARARIDGALAARPKSAPLHYLRALAYSFQNDARRADPPQVEASLRRAIEEDPNYLAAYSKLAELYYNTQQPDRALAEYRKITERRPDDAGTYTLMGMVESSRNNIDAATENYRRALELNPNTTFAANNLAMLYADHGKGNLDEAVRLAQSVVQQFPDEAGYADTLGWVYYKKGLHAAAVEQLQKAVTMVTRRGGDSALYRYHLGLALAGKGDKAGARRELQQALRVAEKNAGAGHRFAQADDARRALSEL